MCPDGVVTVPLGRDGWAAHTQSYRFIAHGPTEDAAVTALLEILPSDPAPVLAERCPPINRYWGRLPPAELRNRIPLSRAMKQFVWKRDGYRCVQCGATERLTVDHVIPRAVGGSNDRANLQTLCVTCNAAKGCD